MLWSGLHGVAAILSLAASANTPVASTRTASRLAGPMMNRRERRQHLQPPGTPLPPPAAPATNLPPAELSGITEDHAYEQYFFDADTRAALLSLLGQFKKPLLLCTPSIAVDAEAAGISYLLLDRDERLRASFDPSRILPPMRGFLPFLLRVITF